MMAITKIENRWDPQLTRVIKWLGQIWNCRQTDDNRLSEPIMSNFYNATWSNDNNVILASQHEVWNNYKSTNTRFENTIIHH